MSHLLSIVLTLSIVVMPSAQSPSHTNRATGTELPFERTVRIPSPNGRWALVASPLDLSDGRTLALEDRKTHRKSIIKRYDRTLRIGWSPDGNAFFLNDEVGSNIEEAYIYWPKRTEPLELDGPILARDSEAKGIPADHTYFRVLRWVTSTTMLVEYCGHNSGSPTRHFDFVYRVSLTGSDRSSLIVDRVSREVSPLGSSATECAQ
jgi:hypothetical protein